MEANGPRVLRGGAFYSIRREVRCAYRGNRYYGYSDYGFRVVVAPIASEV